MCIALIGLWTAVDEYSAQSEAYAQSTGELSHAQELVAGLPRLKERVASRKGELAQLQARCVSEARLGELRSQVHNLARTCGCQVRNVRPGQARSQPWHAGANPLEPGPAKPDDGKGSFQLRSQELTVSLSGSLPATKEFLRKLEAMDLLIHTRQCTLSASGSGAEVNLDLSLQLFDLTKTEKPSA